jgi:sterol 3beta-glucosyltransferase
MANIVIVAVGSRGDVAPLTGIGVRLQEAGHQVVVASYGVFADLIVDCGLEFRELVQDLAVATDLSDVAPLEVAKAFAAFLAPSGMRSIGDAILTALRDEPADLLLLSPFAEFAGHPLAEARGIPSIATRLQPLSATAAYPPAVLGCWSAGRHGNTATARCGAWLIDRFYARTINSFRAELGLSTDSPRRLRRRRTDNHWPILYGYSPSVLPRPADWRPGIDVVGYWWPARPRSWQPPAELTAFLDAGPAPVVVGFGSLVNSRADADRMSAVVVAALRAAGTRGVIQSGWTGLQVSGADMLTIGEVPHDWLFARAAAVVHHCGAGTAAAGCAQASLPSPSPPASVTSRSGPGAYAPSASVPPPSPTDGSP